MGTRADFYLGRGEGAEWLGSIAWDGYPEGLPYALFEHTSEQSYKDFVRGFLAGRKDGTFPEMGWPWPWEDSRTTDFAYAFDDGVVWTSCFGSEWVNYLENQGKEELFENLPETAIFPNMKKIQKVTLGKRSGVIVFSGKET